MTEPGDARDERRAEALRAGLRRARSIDPKESARIDRFVVVGRLGKGAMGVVYEAYDDRLARGVAVKVLRKPRNPTGVTRLRREALALAQLSHPNVVPIYEVGPWEGGLFLAMELVRGKPLSDWAAEGHGPRELLPRLVEAARGLGAAHAAGIVHRDVKPENVLVGEDGHARVLDFGLARREETAEGEAPESKVEGAEAEPEDAAEPARPVDDPVTRDGAAVGTPLYMSPEHFFGRNVGPASDQWGFCAMAYRLLYGRRAFGGDDYPARGGSSAPARSGAPCSPRASCPSASRARSCAASRWTRAIASRAWRPSPRSSNGTRRRSSTP